LSEDQLKTNHNIAQLTRRNISVDQGSAKIPAKKHLLKPFVEWGFDEWNIRYLWSNLLL